ncbi:Permease of the drug/metabolite transporter (DMT) superfamily [Natronincola peptidivorans]|uniref:Permease of the drug/metabolite transporter (DMT) superfamily n=1 Tax=Natronincola peptidivorans TaxID=426128 RepID=A0A1I0DVP3_9FIRM|nr:DMT family transporter [Natronincola peptidivorans]SET36409.1 Permease of the drug/metabolite transporter (DMT) superfamily [Natronincola peptidivorans]
MQESYGAYVKMALGMFISGSAVVVGKMVVVDMPVFLFQMYTLACAMAFSGIILFFRRGSSIKEQLSKDNLLILFFQALMGTFLYRVFLLYGLRFTSAGESGIILSTIPAVIMVLSWIFLKEKMSYYKIIGIIFSILGIVIFNFTASSAVVNPSYRILGNIFVFCAVLGESLFTFLRKKLSPVPSPLVSTFMVSFYGFLLALPLALYQQYHFNFSSLTYMHYLAILYYGGFVTVLSFCLWFAGVSKVSASTAGAYYGIFPVSVFLLSYFILNEAVYFRHIAGLALIVTSIVLLSKKPVVIEDRELASKSKLPQGGINPLWKKNIVPEEKE